jgi:hypothetical protein
VGWQGQYWLAAENKILNFGSPKHKKDLEGMNVVAGSLPLSPVITSETNPLKVSRHKGTSPKKIKHDQHKNEASLPLPGRKKNAVQSHPATHPTTSSFVRR